jgi:hypothetical protein
MNVYRRWRCDDSQFHEVVNDFGGLLARAGAATRLTKEAGGREMQVDPLTA